MSSAALVQDVQQTPLIQPRSQFKFMLGQANLTAALFGNADGDWSLRMLSRPLGESLAYRNRIGAVLKYLRAGRTFAPNMPLSFNAKLVGISDLMLTRYEVPVGDHALHRNPERPGEGVILSPGEAVMFTPAGCGTAVLTRGYLCAVCHFGRWSLFDRHLVESGMSDPGRRHESIVHAALERLGVRSKEDAREVRAALFWSLWGEDFPHPLSGSPHADINTKLHAYVREHLGPGRAHVKNGVLELDLAQIFRAQLIRAGVTQKNIHDDYRYLPKTGTWQDGGAGKPRNAVFIVRHA